MIDLSVCPNSDGLAPQISLELGPMPQYVDLK